jgi:hypothetical protein
MLGDFQRQLQFLGFRPESDVEYLSQPLPYLSPEGAFDGESRPLLRARFHCGPFVAAREAEGCGDGCDGEAGRYR